MSGAAGLLLDFMPHSFAGHAKKGLVVLSVRGLGVRVAGLGFRQTLSWLCRVIDLLVGFLVNQKQSRQVQELLFLGLLKSLAYQSHKVEDPTASPKLHGPSWHHKCCRGGPVL